MVAVAGILPGVCAVAVYGAIAGADVLKPTIWKNCYSQQWAGILIPPAFAHPAKISLALVKKIFAHALELGWIRKGDTCVDPFAGIGGVAFGAMAAGLKFTGQELEPHFVELVNGMDCTDEKLCPTCTARSQQSMPENLFLFDEPKRPHRFEGNLEFWKRKFGLSGAVIVQGDSRKLPDNLRGRVECVVSSPPYAGNEKSDYHLSADGKMRRRDEGRGYRQGAGCFRGSETYGKSAGQLGTMRDKDFDLVVSSPPYADSIRGNGNGIDFSKIKDGGTNRTAAREAIGTGYGGSSAQLAAMPEGCFDIAVSSPLFEDMEMGCNAQAVRRDLTAQGRSPEVTFGKFDGQLGGSGETFWSAAREIVQQCFLALKPGGHAIWVVKDFLRDGRRVEFCEQWRLLCEMIGFKTICTHRAMLVTEITGQQTLAGKIEKKVIKRASFFRKLSEKSAKAKAFFESLGEDEKKSWIEKTRERFHNLSESRILQRARLEAYKAHGEPEPKEQLDVVIDWEMVICMVKPAKTFTRLVLNCRDGAKLEMEEVIL